MVSMLRNPFSTTPHIEYQRSMTSQNRKFNNSLVIEWSYYNNYQLN